MMEAGLLSDLVEMSQRSSSTRTCGRDNSRGVSRLSYYKSKSLQILNALFEVCLLIEAFFISGFIRLFIPFGDTFFFQDILSLLESGDFSHSESE